MKEGNSWVEKVEADNNLIGLEREDIEASDQPLLLQPKERRLMCWPVSRRKTIVWVG